MHANWGYHGICIKDGQMWCHSVYGIFGNTNVSSDTQRKTHAITNVITTIWTNLVVSLRAQFENL